MSIAAIDLGRSRIGVAVTDAGNAGAYPLGAIERSSFKHDVEAIAAMIRGREVTVVVVGLPFNMDGSEGPAARSARHYAERLADALSVKVEMFDERLTSFEAEERLRGLPIRRRSKKPANDAIAATVILEGWLEARPGKSS